MPDLGQKQKGCGTPDGGQDSNFKYIHPWNHPLIYGCFFMYNVMMYVIIVLGMLLWGLGGPSCAATRSDQPEEYVRTYLYILTTK